MGEANSMVVVQEVEQQDARLRSLGIGVDAEVKERFKLTEENLRSRGFREKHKPVGFFSCVGLGLFVFVSVIVGFNYIQLRHPIDPRSAEQLLGVTRLEDATAEHVRNLRGLVDFVQVFHRVGARRLAPSGEFAGEQLEGIGLSWLIGSQYVMSRFLGDGAGVWSCKVFSEDDGVNVLKTTSMCSLLVLRMRPLSKLS